VVGEVEKQNESTLSDNITERLNKLKQRKASLEAKRTAFEK